MKLRIDELNNKIWKEKGYVLPDYDIEKVREKTLNSPRWVHFGAGNIFRAFMVTVNDEMLNAGKGDTGIIVAEGFDEEIIDAAYREYDNLNIYVELKADGSVSKRVNGSVVSSLKMSSEDYFELKEIFENKSPDDFDEETLTTIDKFFENSLNVSETSRQLYIHRNTLVYRLDKLQKSTGLDLRVFEDAITFKIALMVVRYMKYMETLEY